VTTRRALSALKGDQRRFISATAADLLGSSALLGWGRRSRGPWGPVMGFCLHSPAAGPPGSVPWGPACSGRESPRGSVWQSERLAKDDPIHVKSADGAATPPRGRGYQDQGRDDRSTISLLRDS
jgi:hypothetical protein